MKLLLTLLALLVAPHVASAYPDNVRYGYANCASCHVSPTGGGLLTPYGRNASEEFLSTWTAKGEGGAAHGALTTPEWLLVGGDVRALAYSKDNQVYKSRGVIPMQAEVQAGLTYQSKYTAVVTAGAYDRDVQVQNAYVLANLGDHAFVRAGRFFPAFGVNSPEHTLVTRRGLGFDVGQETFNAEAGLVGETGELVVDAILKQGGAEISSEEKGATARAAWYLGGRSQLGVSWLGVKGSVWSRTAAGVFATAGLTQSLYLLSEVDQERKTPAEPDDASTPESTRIVSASKLGWECVKGVHLLAAYESSVTRQGQYDPRFYAAGPGIQWFPRPHLELLAQAQRRYDEAWSDEPGSLLTLMLHYYL